MQTSFAKNLIPEKMVVKNLLTTREEVLVFSTDRYSIAGYVPDNLETSNIIGLFLLSDASYRLADKLGNEFQFDQSGHLTDMFFSEKHHLHFDYGSIKAGKDSFPQVPYRIRPAGEQYVQFLNTLIPEKMKVTNLINGNRETLIFSSDRYALAGYVPEDEEQSKVKILALLSDGSFQLSDKRGIEVSFDPGGQFNGMSARVIKSISQGSHKVELSYEFQGETGPRVTKAKVLEKGKEDTLYAVEYKYGQDGRLCKVISPIGHEIGIKYDEERVIVGRR